MLLESLTIAISGPRNERPATSGSELDCLVIRHAYDSLNDRRSFALQEPPQGQMRGFRPTQLPVNSRDNEKLRWRYAGVVF
jgi:hypothetical protein